MPCLHSLLCTWPSACLAFPTNRELSEDRTGPGTPQSWYGYRAFDFPGLCGCSGIAKTPGSGGGGGGEARGKHCKGPFLLDKFLHCSPPHKALSSHSPPAHWQASQFPVPGREDTLGPGGGAAGSQAERMLIFRSLWALPPMLGLHSSPHRSIPCGNSSEPPLCQGICAGHRSELGHTGFFSSMLVRSREHRTPVFVRPVSPCFSPAPASPSLGFQGGGGLTSCCRSGSQF